MPSLVALAVLVALVALAESLGSTHLSPYLATLDAPKTPGIATHMAINSLPEARMN